MKTSDFIASLRAADDMTLRFHNESGEAVPSGYHLTEIKAVGFDTVDCGGQTNHWQETIFQIWVPEEADTDFMSAVKFISIFDKVRSAVKIDMSGEAKIEYGDENIFPSVYSIASIKIADDKLNVALTPPLTTCKARDRSSAACCS